MRHTTMKSLLVVASVTAAAGAQVDTLQILVGKDYTTGGVSPVAAFAAYGYRPANNADPLNPVAERYYAVGFSGTGQDIREINPTTTPPTFTRLVTNLPYTLFTKDGNPDRGGGAPTPGSLLLNKTAIGSIGAYGAAFIADGGGLVTTGTTQNPELTQRIYRYNLQLDTNADAREEMTSLVTLQQMKDVVGTTSNTSNVSRQVALSTDSSKVYFVDTSTIFGGLWQVNSLGGGLARVVADGDLTNEPSVSNVGGADRIYLRGTAASSNNGGLDYYDTADSTRKIAVSAAAVADFMQTTTADISILSTATDAEGNVYFNNNDSSPERRGIYKLDTEGRLIKVVSYAERNAFIQSVYATTANANTLRMQTRTGTVNGFDVTQVTFADQGTPASITAAHVFKPGDFNRDNAVDSADIALFKSKLTVRDVALPVADARYDLNGNNVSDWKDVKVLQTFLGFENGDADIDFATDFDDLLILAQNYEGTGKRWTEGDFDGDNDVDFEDLLTLAQNYDVAPELIDGTQLGQSFVSEWNMALSLVPEPATLGLLLGGVAVGLRRTHRK